MDLDALRAFLLNNCPEALRSMGFDPPQEIEIGFDFDDDDLEPVGIMITQGSEE